MAMRVRTAPEETPALIFRSTKFTTSKSWALSGFVPMADLLVTVAMGDEEGLAVATVRGWVIRVAPAPGGQEDKGEQQDQEALLLR
jgi:hypothetical protein